MRTHLDLLQVVRSCQVISQQEAAENFVCHRGLPANHRFVRDSERLCFLCLDWLRSAFYCYVTLTLRKNLSLTVIVTTRKRRSHKNESTVELLTIATEVLVVVNGFVCCFILQEQDHLRLTREWQQDASKLTIGRHNLA